ncbi:MAG TPA: ELWxxDGT repeat protein, partial [Baekduia sp.]|nr:ELWxxDGT repeat protein [Baekduia sp.]
MLFALAAAPAATFADDLGSNPWDVATAGNSHYYTADDGVHGRELFRTVGDSTTPELVTDLAPGSESSDPWHFVPIGDTLYFSAKDPTYQIPAMGGGTTPGDRLYQTDGTAAGTHVVTIAGGEHPESVQKWGNRLVFSSVRPGTTQVVDLWLADNDGSNAQRLTANLALTGAGGLTDLGDGRAVFAARGSGVDEEPWITDGTAAGTHRVADVWPGDHWSNPMEFASIGGGRFTFIAYDADHGRELWVSDGTEAGTQLLKDIQPGPNSSQPGAPRPYNGVYYFLSSFPSGMWRTDGTPAGTQPAGPEAWGAFGYRLANGLIVRTVATGDQDYQLWVTDGTEAGTHMLKELFPGGTLFQDMLVVDGVLYFTATPNHYNGPTQLWRSDGTDAGTYQPDLGEHQWTRFPAYLTDFGDGLIGFRADDGVHGYEPWITDGTAAGTKIVNINTTVPPPPVEDPAPGESDGSGGDGDDGPASDGGTSGDGEATTPVPESRSTRAAAAAVPSLTLTVARKADAALPFRYAGRGALSAGGSCSGTVTLSLTRGTRTVGRTTARLARDCTYQAAASKT